MTPLLKASFPPLRHKIKTAPLSRGCICDHLAVRGGFEPPVRLNTVRRFSKPVISATHPPNRVFLNTAFTWSFGILCLLGGQLRTGCLKSPPGFCPPPNHFIYILLRESILLLYLVNPPSNLATQGSIYTFALLLTNSLLITCFREAFSSNFSPIAFVLRPKNRAANLILFPE